MAGKKAARKGERGSGSLASKRGASARRQASASSSRKAAAGRKSAIKRASAASRGSRPQQSRGAREPSAIRLLKQDHREVEQLFDRFEKASASEKAQIAQQVCAKLTVHAQIEEELLYPAAKQALEEDDRELVDEANVEHATAKDLIAQIESGRSDELFDAKVKVLGEYIKHHVQEEEGELFPKLKQTQLDLDALGTQLASRKAELTEEFGLQAQPRDDEADIESNLDPSRRAGDRGGRPSAAR